MRQKLRPRRPSHPTVVAYLALFVALGGTTYAATGGNFILGQSNTAGSTTALSSGTTGPALKVTSTNNGTGATALGLNVATGHPPFTVNSGTKVAKLNADKLDGKDATNWKVTNVIAAAGPLPVQGTFTSSGGPFLIMASGSGYRTPSNADIGRIGMRMKIDGGSAGTVSGYTNEFNSHKPFVTGFQAVSGVAAGSHTISLEPINDAPCGVDDIDSDVCTTTDNRDNFRVAVIEMPF
jgi:hypothetical protein